MTSKNFNIQASILMEELPVSVILMRRNRAVLHLGSDVARLGGKKCTEW